MKRVFKLFESKQGTVNTIIDAYTEPKKILIVFWHGLGDTLMFLPLFRFLKQVYPQHTFNLSLLPGVGQGEYIGTLALPENNWLDEHDDAFVISFPMSEGNLNYTKVEYCCLMEMGLNLLDFMAYKKDEEFVVPIKQRFKSKFVAVHLQGTCLPGSTNPDNELAEKIWNDIVSFGYIPIDCHFKHAFHNPVNHSYPWVTRSCRDLKPDIFLLDNVIETSFAFVGVASGPFVVALAKDKSKVIYLQKHHNLKCYTRDNVKVIDLMDYKSETLKAYLDNLY